MAHPVGEFQQGICQATRVVPARPHAFFSLAQRERFRHHVGLHARRIERREHPRRSQACRDNAQMGCSSLSRIFVDAGSDATLGQSAF
jgi:hypothetical protein